MPTSVSQRHQQPAVLGELLCPLRGQVRAAHRGHDAVERRLFGNAIEAVAAQHRDPGIAGSGQQPPGLCHHVLGDIHGDHQALLADQLGQEGGVVAGARPDLQDSAAGREVEQLEHVGDQRRLGGGAGRQPGAELLHQPGPQRGVGVDELEVLGPRTRRVVVDRGEVRCIDWPVEEGLEQAVAGHGTERLFHRR
jgi:hypothetical protein